MEKTLTREAKTQLASSLRRRYQTASSRAKKQILDEFVAVSGYHPKYAIHLLNAAEPSASERRGRVRPTLYDEAAKRALIVLWEASDRVCGKRLKPLLRILLPSLERHGHLKLDEAIRSKVLAMSAATIDRLLRVARQATRGKKRRRVVPEIRRRVRSTDFRGLERSATGLYGNGFSRPLRGCEPRKLCTQPGADRYRQRLD